MNHLSNPSYSPNRLINKVQEMMRIQSDLQLAIAISVDRTTIAKIRKKKVPVGASMLLRLHDLTGLPAKELQKWMRVEA
ncbi:hypothetical protein [Herbaspirillum sp. ST 5-3]|uniref:hypothetical protein n=1 Tax=Oxalobacteraceae TaxID=75682 RepID=UPI0010A5886B|nr:hypothetical protein [Herbaspirillum sp. ST 5-3]